MEDIDTHIAELEYRIQHDSLSLNEEKKVLEQIKALKKSRRCACVVVRCDVLQRVSLMSLAAKVRRCRGRRTQCGNGSLLSSKSRNRKKREAACFGAGPGVPVCPRHALPDGVQPCPPAAPLAS